MALLRRLMAIEAAAFSAAALVHTGVVVRFSVHSGAAVAESVIALVLIAGALIAWSLPGWTRVVALAAQAFGLAGTLIGLYLAIRGVAPHTIPDLIFHAGAVTVLAAGLVYAARART